MQPDADARTPDAASGFPLGHDEAAVRLHNARGSIRSAFDSLETGITFEELTRYIESDFHTKALAGIADDPERFHARLCGLVAAAALTIVEADRRQAVDARFRQTGGVA